MSIFNYEYFIKNYIERTQDNLKIIDALDEIISRFDEDQLEELYGVFDKRCLPWEITQLINSLFGLLVVSNEYYKSKINKRYDEVDYLIDKPGYLEIVEIITQLKKENRLRSTYCKEKNEEFKVRNFLNHLRNSLAHSGRGMLLFWPCKEGEEISEVYFCDTNYDGGNNEAFCAKIDVQTIRKLKDNIAKLYSSIDDCNDCETINEKKKKYDDSINNREAFLDKKVDKLLF